MRRNHLLFFMILSLGGMVNAQSDTIRSLVITEAFVQDAPHCYIEFTNMGDDTLNLMDFEWFTMTPWSSDIWTPEFDTDWLILGEYIKEYSPDVDTLLYPGESFLAAAAYDYNPEQYKVDPLNWSERSSKPALNEMADLNIHISEATDDDPSDSVSVKERMIMMWGGRNAWAVRYHFNDGSDRDSVVVDAVNAVFDNDEGNRNTTEPKACAGVENASFTHVLVRKFSVKQGNPDYASARGVDLNSSEWIPVPYFRPGQENDNGWGTSSAWDAPFWTVKEHGDYNLDATTLVPKHAGVSVDFNNQVITVPWGTRRNDSLMFQFEYRPGLAWQYKLSPVFEDSASLAAHTGDTLVVFACGNDLDEVQFRIEVTPPTADDNIVIPARTFDDEEEQWNIGGQRYGAIFDVSDGVPGMDTISNVDFATRVDTLFKYLVKAPEADWDIVFVDGVERADLKEGDKLKVTSQGGSEKEYYIKVDDYLPDDNALLGAITWPDIPDFYKGFIPWVNGDTLPDFAPGVYNYVMKVPGDVAGIPVLVPSLQDPNAKVVVKRPVNLSGTKEQRSYTFSTTAQDDSTTRMYTVELVKEVLPENIQPYSPDPYISELDWWERWNGCMLEIVNPGTTVLDMSDYMICWNYVPDPVDMITGVNEPSDFASRYVKYIPGYVWQNKAEWDVQPRIAVKDPNVLEFVQPGDVFVMGGTQNYSAFFSEEEALEYWGRCDVVIGSEISTWGDSQDSVSIQNAANTWQGNLMLFKILNDSIKQGLKPATDPNDFELIDAFGMADGSAWVVAGIASQRMNEVYIRKPEITEGNPVMEASFGTNEEDTEWLMYDQNYWADQGSGWPDQVSWDLTQDIGKHFFIPETDYMSTVSSTVYLVSPGYTVEEEIRGLVTGVTVDGFYTNLIPADPNQTWTVVSGTSGNDLASTDEVANGDTLVVLSADGSNTTKYLLDVSAEGLSSDAVLTSDVYTVTVDGATGTVEGFDYGITLKAMLENVTVPSGAKMVIVDDKDELVPLTRLNLDTVYVDVQVSDKYYLEVLAEDGETQIVYQLKPNATESDAFVYSDVYAVSQEELLISLVEPGTTVESFYGNLTPTAGATMQVRDKTGLSRMAGELYLDDNLLVTAADLTTTNTYFLTFLREDVNYLAYVTSGVYLVDQNNLVISSEDLVINEETTVEDFLGNLNPAAGATVTVLDSEGTEKTTGTMAVGDMVQVTAGDGVTVVVYTVTVVPVGMEDLEAEGIRLFPNPTSGEFRVSGLDAGNRVQVFTILGNCVFDQPVFEAERVISLQESGLYVVVVSSGEEVIGHYRLIVE